MAQAVRLGSSAAFPVFSLPTTNYRLYTTLVPQAEFDRDPNQRKRPHLLKTIFSMLAGAAHACGLGLVLFALVACEPLAAETLTGRVVGVTDGDTIKLLVAGRSEYKIRLGEIDAPESGQPYGKKSKRMLSDLVFNRNVTVRVTDIDRYGRSVGVIRTGAINVNAEMVKLGGAWAYRRYLSDQRYLLWEKQAQQGRLGLWALQRDQIMAPWEWRAARRGQGKGRGRVTNDASAASHDYRAATYVAAAPSHACGVKWKCAQMNSCAEARYQLRVCGLGRLDGDGDGVPCEKLCG
jgi:endonuclease YncB( thermonuclease family)